MMTHQDLERQLSDRCEKLDLKQQAFDGLAALLADEQNRVEDVFAGFDPRDIKPVFEGFKYVIDQPHRPAVIRTRIRLYGPHGTDSFPPIGYYELETDFEGNILDDFFVMEKERYVDDLAIISHFRDMNQVLPPGYLKRNYIQYEYVAYVSLIGTLFASKQFNAAYRFVQRARVYLQHTDPAKFDQQYLQKSRHFIKMVADYLEKNNLADTAWPDKR
ncbi:hypothetical protein [Taibaiella chishuiensis]|uniref:Uncharacterized protein n=1 Tax=Taibaiella chishuiensis TaxID=1434707 RepID=A0A2P8D0D8_9BACT|nr:hypothetical protein [Taibaiella chishuiensis]PSK90671.1 hypothetical protein B0I18_10781 [Taibaiella chishuiensis]